jgi:hypothetical protein
MVVVLDFVGFFVLRREPKALNILGKYSTTELHLYSENLILTGPIKVS